MALIDIGNPAVDWDSQCVSGYTYILCDNPANASGKITQIELWAATELTNCEVATFYVVSGNNLSTRDSQNIGTIPAGSKQTRTVDLTVVAGDYIGFTAVGNLGRMDSGGHDYWYRSSDTIPCTNQLFTFHETNRKLSLYGTGSSVIIPTITTQAVTNIDRTTATGNGNIINTGGENCTTRGFCYMVGTSGDPTTANSKVYDTGSFGTGAFSKGLTGLAEGTNYRVRAYAINSAGTGYGTTVQMQTKLKKNYSEAFSIVDSKITKISKVLGEAFSAVDSWTRRIHLSEVFSIADSLIKNVIKQLSEAFSIADSWVVKIKLSETFSIADSLVRSVTKQLGEVFSTVDSKATKVVRALGESLSIIDSFAHTIILHFYEALSVKDSAIAYLNSLWHKVIKIVGDWTKVGKEKSDCIKVGKEKGDWTKVDKKRGTPRIL